ncbi:hypothetical protein BJN45_14320 [Azonexus hydrophilus]|uniref:histidine kinase n=1 Tax=Azonexus hydrophilus TaxID=418702 RepID=A0A1R1I165_9RHOO|nr:sensor histidine kinase [Azonexus hydrophilus]OMG52468.1 hypothetical protein BJN45_14320 [Azonexus hydrophilus]
MKRRIACFFVALTIWLLAGPAVATTLSLTAETPRVSLEGRLEHFADAGQNFSFEAVQAQPFSPLPDFRSLGYGTDAHWFRVKLDRATGAPPHWVLSIGMPELEEVDIWVELPQGSFQHHALGYHRPYDERPLQTRLFAVPFELAEHTTIYFRVRTTNAILVMAELWQPSAFVANETEVNFHRGIYFGILLVAILLYAILGARLHDVTMAAYAGYVASQTLFHLGTNGYLPVLFSSHLPWFTDALPRIGWLGGAISIVLMWDRLLNLRTHFPHIHRLYQFTIFLNLALLPFALMPFLVRAEVLYVVKLANYLNILNFFISMGLLLIFWWRKRRIELVLYFIAFVIPALGTLVNTAANQGYLSQNAITSNLYLIAPLVHVLVMSFGLALRLRQLQHDKATAEQEAAVTSQRAEEQRRFVAMLSHEFRNPLAAIDRATQMLQIKMPVLPPPEKQRLTQIRANVATLSGFVDNFLMTEALDRGSLPMTREVCPLLPLLQQNIHQLGESATERVVLQVLPETASFSLDPTLIGVAISNLLNNALRYSPEGSPVKLLAHLKEDVLYLTISDTGPGLSDEELIKLGSPYFRAASSLGKKGSGLGHHFARRIIEAHGGSLRTESPPSGGLRVEIRVP